MNKPIPRLTLSERRLNHIVMEMNDREYTDLMTPAQLEYIKSWTQYMLKNTPKGYK